MSPSADARANADHLLGNPWAEPPEPSDWEIRPTYPVQTVPYFLAPIWDERQAEARRRAANAPKAMPDDPSGKIPKDLRQKLKKAKGAKSLLQDLEEEVRGFVQKWEAKEAQLRSEGLADVDSSEDEEIVFVGRNGQTRERQAEKKAEEKLARDKLVFDSLVDDHGAAFGFVVVSPYFDNVRLTLMADAGSSIRLLPTTTFGRGRSPPATLLDGRHMLESKTHLSIHALQTHRNYRGLFGY